MSPENEVKDTVAGPRHEARRAEAARSPRTATADDAARPVRAARAASAGRASRRGPAAVSLSLSSGVMPPPFLVR